MPTLPRVVCADDSVLICAMVRDYLDARYEVVTAADGATALDTIRETAPDVVLCDLEMPRMNGLQLLSVLKGDPALAPIPFILMTGTSRGQVVDAALEAGADDFVPKNFTPEELRARVGAAVRSRILFRELQAQHGQLARMNGLLAMSRARTRAIIESAHDGIVTLALDGRIENLNPSASRTFGYQEEELAATRFLSELVAPRCRAIVAEDVRTTSRGAGAAGSSPRRELVGLRRDGGEFPLELRLTRVDGPGGSLLCAFVRDLTEARRLELELQQAQKLEAVGRLAAGIAHEINTPIQYIGDNTRFVEEVLAGLLPLLSRHREAARAGALTPALAAELEREAEALEVDYFSAEAPQILARTLEGVQRVATIVRAMKEFAQPDQRTMVPTDLNRALLATVEVARNEHKYVAEIELDLGAIPPVVCHPGDLNQVFLNVLVNAANAIEDAVQGTGRRGTIRIATRLDGDHVDVAIADTGGGIPEPIRTRIFDPFFTTKEVGRGTGQGLAISRNIVRMHEGTIRFETEVGRGTTFTIRLPVAPSAARRSATGSAR